MSAGEDLHLCLLRGGFFEEAEAPVDVADDQFAIFLQRVWVAAEFLFILFPIYGIRAGIVTPNQFGGRMARNDPRGRSLETSHAGAGEGSEFREDLDRAAAVPDQAYSFGGVVEGVVPGGAVGFMAEEGVQAWDGGPGPVGEDAAGGDEDVEVFGPRAFVHMADGETPLGEGFDPLGSFDCGVELHVAVEVPFSDRALEIFFDFGAGGVEV